MTVDVVIVFLLVCATVALLVSERFSLGVTALIILSTLMVTRVLTPAEGLSGFANPATITIAAMLVLSEGLKRTGVLDLAGRFFIHLAGSHRYLVIASLMVAVGGVSAFINNTAAVAVFIPVVLVISREIGLSPSKLLMPVSFASIFGGVSTLIGTSTNILVSSIAKNHGLEGFGMFEMTPLGLVFFVTGIAFMLLIGIRLIPPRRPSFEKTGCYGVNQYITDMVMLPGSPHLGKPLLDSGLLKGLDLEVLYVYRSGGRIFSNPHEIVLEPGDTLRTCGNVQEINKLVRKQEVRVGTTEHWTDKDLETKRTVLMEAIVAPNSSLVHTPIKSVKLKEHFGAVPLAIMHRGRLRQEELGAVHLQGGDSLLLAMDVDRVEELQNDPSFVLATQVPVTHPRVEKMPIALMVMAGVVAATALNLTPIVVSALVGVGLMVLTGCLTSEEAYRSINWEVILLLAGVIPLSLAMEKSGAADLLARQIIDILGAYGPRIVLCGLLAVTMLLTEMISNQASAALLAPMVIQAAYGLDVDPRPFLMAVAFGASFSFMTPIGYQTNTLVYGPGQYKFTDYTKVGFGLTILFWIIGSLLIPVFWPF